MTAIMFYFIFLYSSYSFIQSLIQLSSIQFFLHASIHNIYFHFLFLNIFKYSFKTIPFYLSIPTI